MAEDREFQSMLIGHLSSLIDGMKVLNQSVANNLQTTHRFDAEFIKLSRQNMQLRDEMIEFRSEMRADLQEIRSEMGTFRSGMRTFRSEMAEFRAEVNSRLDALFHRVGELENTVEGCVTQLRELAIEARSQYNEILNALQGNLQNRSAIEDLNERLEALERRFGV